MPPTDPYLEDFPAEDQDRLEEGLRRFDRAWRRGERPAIDDYLPPAGAERRAALVELVHIELEYRLKAGERVRAADYLGRYPELGEEDVVVRALKKAEAGAATAAGPAGGPAPAAPGRLGPFELLERVGSGSFGAVYKAFDTRLGRLVALKVPRPGALAGPEGAERFLREARSAAGLRHPAIVSVHDVGRDGETCSLVTDFVPGMTLAQRLRADPPDFRQAAHWVAQIAEALEHAHSLGVVHRDVKPANVLIDEQGRPHVTDFGLARRDSGDPTLTQEGQLLGTPAYMSPEQARGDAYKVDARSDVYSPGVVLYQLLTGTTPFRGDVRTVLARVLGEEPRPPRRLADRVPRELDTVCLKCLEKEPERRYQSASELADELRRWLRGEPVKARPAGVARRAAKWARRRPGVAGLLGLSLALLLGLLAGAAYFTRQLRDERDVARDERRTAQRERDQARRANRLARRHLYAAHTNLAYREWQKGNLERALALLNDHLPGAGGEDLRGFEWRYLWRLCHHDLVLRGHGGMVNAVAFLPGGARLASAGDDGTVRVWDSATGRPVAVLRGHSGPVLCLALAPGGKVLATGGADGTVKLWDPETLRERATLRGHDRPVAALAFSPGGGTLASAGRDGAVRLWEVRTGRERFRLDPTEGGRYPEQALPVGVAFTPDGRSLVTTPKFGQRKVWDLATRRVRARFRGPLLAFNGMALSPDGRTMATASDDRTIQLWDLTSLKETATLRRHADAVNAVSFSPDGRSLASVGLDRTVRLWDVATGRGRLTLKGHTGPVSCVAFTPGGRALATGGRDRTVRLWELSTGRARPRPAPHQPSARGVPEAQRRDRLELQSQAGPVMAVAFSPDGKTLAVAEKGLPGLRPGAVTLWDPVGATRVAPLRTRSNFLFSLAFSPDGRLLAVGQKVKGSVGALTLWDVATRSERPARAEVFGAVYTTAFSPDGKVVGFGGGLIQAEGELALWDVAAGRRVARHHEKGDYVRAVTFSPDGKTLAAVRGDGRLTLWDAGLRRQVLSFRAHDQRVFQVAFSPDGKTLATASRDGTAKVWDALTGRQLAVLRGHVQSVTCVAFSPDGRSLATGSGEGTVKLWDPETGQERLTLPGGAGIIWSVAFSPEGLTLAAGAEGGRVFLWPAADPEMPG